MSEIVRVPPKLRAEATRVASIEGVSLSQWVTRAVWWRLRHGTCVACEALLDVDAAPAPQCEDCVPRDEDVMDWEAEAAER